LATWGRRVGGWLIDWLLVTIVVGVIEVPTHLLRTTTTIGSVHTASVHTGGVLIGALIAIAYGGLLCGSTRGQTVGMMAVGVRAVRLDTGGSIGFGRGVGRAAVEYALAFVLFLPWVIDMLFPLWDPRRQTLHDKATGTVVVRR
jgi:uncharacterized RDD family membrane protein YckC